MIDDEYDILIDDQDFTIPTPLRPLTPVEAHAELISIIPQNFWMDKNLTNRGEEYIALRTMSNNYLTCSPENILSVENSQLSKNTLWKPILIRDTYIALQSYNGKFLGLKNSNFTCNFEEMSNDNYFDVLINPLQYNLPGGTMAVAMAGRMSPWEGNGNEDFLAATRGIGGTNAIAEAVSINGISENEIREVTLAFSIDGGYLGYEGNSIIFSDVLNNNTLFKAPEMR